MRITIPLTLCLLGSAAQAHPGHLIEAAGHDHWLGAAAIGAAIAIGLWNAAKGRKDQAKTEGEYDDGADATDEAETDAELQEA